MRVTRPVQSWRKDAAKSFRMNSLQQHSLKSITFPPRVGGLDFELA